MNEHAARHAVKTAILDNLDDILDGLSAQGNQREMTVTTSVFTPALKYYWCLVRSDGARDVQKHTNLHGVYRADYGMIIELADYAIPQPFEDAVYEKMDGQFRLMSDRVVGIIESTDKFCYTKDGVEYCYKLVNDGRSPVVSKSNIDTIDFDAEGTVIGLILASILRFSLEDC
jgi:hypothetical protein